jgi:hypothetical protein
MKKIAFGCLGLIGIFILCIILFGVFGAIETTAKNDDTAISTSVFVVFIIGGVLTFFLFKRLLRKKVKKGVIKETVISTIEKKEEKQNHFSNFDFPVTGIFYESIITGKPRQKHIKEIYEFEGVELERDLNNEHDDNAVLVSDMLGQDLGYVKATHAKRVARFLDNKDYIIEAFVSKKYKIEDGYAIIIEVDVYKK